MTWHANADLLDRYSRGDLDYARASSVEAHVVVCDACRALVATTVDDVRLATSWAEIDRAVDAPRPGPVERLLGVLGVRPHVARLLAATPSLRVPWIVAALTAVSFATLAARAADGERAMLLFLMVAPLVPVAGVAAAYSPELDPTSELTASSPVGSLRLLLLRATAVLTASILLTGAAALALPGASPLAAAWLVPALALTVTSLALATAVRPLSAAVWTALVWVVGVLASEMWADGGLSALLESGSVNSALFRPAGQLALVAVAVVAAVLLANRRQCLDVRRTL